MHQLMRRATVFATAALLLAATSLLVLPNTAHAETKRVSCGDEVMAKPGDKIVGTLDKGADDLLKFDLGTVEESTTSLIGNASNLITGLLGSLSDLACEVTVTVADAAAQVPGVDKSASKKVKDGAEKLNKGTHNAGDTVNKLASPDKSGSDEGGGQEVGGAPDGDQNTPADDGAPDNSSGAGTTGDSDADSHEIASPDSPASGAGVPLQPAFLPTHFDSNAAPMRDYRGIPHAVAGEFTPAPGVRYGRSVEDYAPQFDLLATPEGTDDAAGEADSGPGNSNTSGAPADTGNTVTKAGQAETMLGSTGKPSDPASAPVLLAVIALAMSTAGLVRTWVLRRV